MVQKQSPNTSAVNASNVSADGQVQSTNALPNLEQIFGDEQITHISFNQDLDAFATGTTKGFAIFSLEPFRFRVKRSIEGGVKVV